MCTLYFVVFVDKRHGVSWETQCLIAAAVRLRTKPTHTPAPYSTLGPIPRLAMAYNNWGRGPHPSPEEKDWIVAKDDGNGYEFWYCTLCKKTVTKDNGHLTSEKHRNAKSWAPDWQEKASPAPAQAAPRSFASQRSAAPASHTSGTATDASASSSALSMVVDAGSDTIRIELPADVAAALKRALDRALGSHLRLD